jgi:hypothetical protein
MVRPPTSLQSRPPQLFDDNTTTVILCATFAFVLVLVLAFLLVLCMMAQTTFEKTVKEAVLVLRPSKAGSPEEVEVLVEKATATAHAVAFGVVDGGAAALEKHSTWNHVKALFGRKSSLFPSLSS